MIFVLVGVLLALATHFSHGFTGINYKMRSGGAGVRLSMRADSTKGWAAAFVGLGMLGFPDASLADRPLNAASAAGTRVNSDAESLLRYGLPINCKEIRDVQGSLESAKSNLKTRRVNFAKGDVGNAKSKFSKEKAKILGAVPASRSEQAQKVYDRMVDEFSPLEVAMNAEQEAGPGSLQERKALDEAFSAQDALAKDLSILEELMVPEGFKRAVPDELKNMPILDNRARIEFEFDRPGGEPFNVDGVNFDKIKIEMVIDGYNAPVTGGNFVDLVNKGFYNNKKIDRSDGFVVQMGDADKEGQEGPGPHGYVENGKERKVPLEVALKNDKNLYYGSDLEEENKGSSATVLPFQSYGTLGMAREEFDSESASSQFFWLLFESDLTPAGKNMLDGRYTCFGYTVEGADKLKSVRIGDVITSTKILSGKENLHRD